MFTRTIQVLFISTALVVGADSFSYAEDKSASSETTGSIAADQLAQIDANNDGTIEPDELSAAAEAGSVSCGPQGIEPMFTGLGEVDESFAVTAKDIRVVEITNCDPADVEASLGTANNVRLLLGTNDRVTAAIQAEGAKLDDVLRVGKTGDALVVFIPADPVKL